MLLDTVLDVTLTLRVLLPVSVVGEEQEKSKHYLRSAMLHERVVGLAPVLDLGTVD